jgi:lipopolysaccharide transport system ATP-binding protein
MDTVIRIENISKQYRLGTVGTGTIAHDINRTWHKLRGKEDPYSKIGETNRAKKSGTDYVWALKDLNFSVNHGDVLGIIGRNGAGKSTLLKILSRTTAPTTGQVKMKGRVASLLEVGTGFHPELSGKENIFLNGAILGMSRHEIRKKFDEIVDFAGVGRYIDTPVKRYSSGMYVRLAFGVAAHLEPEILIIDEVLAVGDAEFQKKALGKMKDVSRNEGRTVLFVSHNMEAVQNLCNKAILLKDGLKINEGLTDDVVKSYMTNYVDSRNEVEYTPETAPGNDLVRLLLARVFHDNFHSYNHFNISDNIQFEFSFSLYLPEPLQLDITYHLEDERGILIYVGTTIWEFEKTFTSGRIDVSCVFPSDILNEGNYTISKLLVVQNKGNIICQLENVISFDIIARKINGYMGWSGRKQGVIKPAGVQWTFKHVK